MGAYEPLVKMPEKEAARAILAAYFPKKENKPRKFLTTQHKLAVALLLEGKKLSEVHKVTGLAHSTISGLMNEPEVKSILQQTASLWKHELEALMPAAVDAIRTGLHHGDTTMRLKAVDRFVKMAQIDKLEDAPALNATINFVTNTRIDFFEKLREAAAKAGVLSATVMNKDGTSSPLSSPAPAIDSIIDAPVVEVTPTVLDAPDNVVPLRPLE